MPVTVVQDRDACLAVTVGPGAPFTFFAHPFGAHPWAGYAAWFGSTVLQLQRDGDAYAAWKFFDLDHQFTQWYINFQEPGVRRVDASGGGSYDTADLGLDIVIPGDDPLGTGKTSTTPTRWSQRDGSPTLNGHESRKRPIGSHPT